MRFGLMKLIKNNCQDMKIFIMKKYGVPKMLTKNITKKSRHLNKKNLGC